MSTAAAGRCSFSGDPVAESVAIETAHRLHRTATRAALVPSERAARDAIEGAIGVTADQLHVGWSDRGYARSLWASDLRLPTPAGATAADRARAWLYAHRALFGICDPTTDLVLDRSTATPASTTTLVLHQHHGGLRVFDAQLTVTLDGAGDIRWLAGDLVPDSAIPADRAVLTAADAATLASGAPSSATLGIVDPLLYGREGPVRPAWRVNSAGPDEAHVFLDAVTGVELARVRLSRNVRSATAGGTRPSSARPAT